MDTFHCMIRKFFFVMFLLSSFCASSQSAEITGQLTGNDESPLSNTLVSLYYPYYQGGDGCSSWYSQSVVTDLQGMYTFQIDSTGTYYVKAGGPSSGYGQLWWTSTGNTPDCNYAQSIVINDLAQTESEKNFQLSPEATIHGLVTNNGAPVSDIFVTANLVSNPCYSNTTVSATTNTAGEYTLSGLAAGSYIIQTEKWNSAGAPFIQEKWSESLQSSVQDCNQADYVTVASSDSITGIDFQIEKGGSISGKVTDSASGEGVAYMSVILYSLYSESESPCNSYNSIWSSTDSEGAYTFSGLSPGEYYIRVSPDSDMNYIPEWWSQNGSVQNCSQAKKNIVTADEDITGRNFQLEPGGTISGNVQDADAMIGIGEVAINVYNADSLTGCSTYLSTFSKSVYTDSQGNYTVSGLPPGPYYIGFNNSWSAPEYIYAWWTEGGSVQDCFLAEPAAVINPETPLTDKNLYLHKGASISGRVTESQGGAPIADAFVSAYRNSTSGCGGYNSNYSYSDDQGYFTISGLRPGSHTLYAWTNRHLREYWRQDGNGYFYQDADPIVISTAGELISGKNFQLEQGAIISGKVTNSNGQAIPEVDVWAFTGDNSCSQMNWGYWGSSDAQGEFAIRAPAGQSYYIRSEDYGNSYYMDGWWSSGGTVFTCATAQAQLLTETGLSNVFFTLQHGATLSGSVKDSQGTALAGVSVEAYSSSDPCTYDYLSGVYKYAATDTNGQFTIQALPAGNYYLNAYGSYILDSYHTPNGTSTDCNSAVAIPVGHQQEITDKGFTVQFGGRISGAIYDVNQDHISSQDHTLMIYNTNPCSDPSGWLGATVFSCSLTYTSGTLPPGEYYVGAREGIDFNNTPETWWGFPNTVSDCASAQKVLVEARKTRRNTDFYRTLPYGDVNNDGNIDVVDILIGLKVISGSSPSPLYQNMGDVNQNGVIDLIDTIQIMEKIAQ